MEKVGKGWERLGKAGKRLGRFPRAGCGTADPEVSPRDKNRNKERDKDRELKQLGRAHVNNGLEMIDFTLGKNGFIAAKVS